MGIEEIYKLFYQGEHSKVVAETLDRDGQELSTQAIPPVVSSLTFLGRIQEAELLFQQNTRALTEPERVMCRFFLGVVHCRHFHFLEARKYFGENAVAVRLAQRSATSNLSHKEFFYLYQGVGFYRYTYGHLRSARRWASLAYQNAFQANFLFGRLFSQDLLAHTEVNLGRTHLGLKLIDQNISLAQNLGRGALIQMFKVSRAIYRARFGIAAREAIEDLLSTLSETTFEDGYSRACLLAELSHQYLLRGNATKAKETLNSACEYVYRIDNPRLEILLNFRLAVLLSQQGELSQSMHLVRNSLKRLENNVDRLLELRLRGLELSLLTKLNNQPTPPEVMGKLKALTSRTGYLVGQRMLGRAINDTLQVEKFQDPIGDLYDEILRCPSEAISTILETSWYGLLYRVFQVDVTSKTILIGIEGKSLTLFEKGNVHHIPRGASNQVAKFLLFLSGGERTKEAIIEKVWEQKYHPLRHDPLLYSLVSKLRKELGPEASWVEATENGYQLQLGVIVTDYIAKTSEPLPPIENLPKFQPGFNFRQQQILDLLEKRRALNVSECIEAFQISAATANRDLVFLEKKGLAYRTGKGRATRYHSNSGGKNGSLST